MKNIKIWAAIAALLAAGCSQADSSSDVSSPNKAISSLEPSVPKATVPVETEAPSVLESVQISFDTRRQAGEASNQYAIWIEDGTGRLVKTLYVSDFAGRRRGYQRRPDAVCHWTAEANPENISDDALDAVSGATFDDGNHQIIWDLTDHNGNKIQDGIYTIYVEGTLYWTSNVLFTAEIDINHPSNNIAVEEVRSEPDNQKNADMISNVRMEAVYD